MSTARYFLDRFLPTRKPAAEEYLYPELVNEPHQEFSDAFGLMEQLQRDTQESYGIYWYRVGDGEPLQAMMFFTEDGGLIAGLVGAETDPADALRRAGEAVRARYGYVTFDERPPDTLKEFRALAAQRAGVRLVDGEHLK